MDKAWSSLLSVTFAIGEQALNSQQQQVSLSSSPSSSTPALPFSTAEEQDAMMSMWMERALLQATERRAGDSQGIELSAGGLLLESDVRTLKDGNLLELFHATIQVQCLLKSDRAAAERTISGIVQKFMSKEAYRRKTRETAQLLARMYLGPPPITAPMIWEGFFSRLFEVGEFAGQRQILLKADVEAQEPWLYLGLPALTALQVVLRSAPPPSPFRLALGEVDVDEKNVPEEGREMIGYFVSARESLHSLDPLPLNAGETQILCVLCLWSERDDKESDIAKLQSAMERERLKVVKKVVSDMAAVATLATQLHVFKERFDEVMTLLAACL